MELAVSALFAFGIWLAVTGAVRMLQAPGRVSEVLELYQTEPHTLEEIELAQPFTDRVVRPLLHWFARTLTRMAPQRNVEMIRHKLELAGNPYDWTVTEFLGFRVLVAILTAGLGMALFYVIGAGPGIVLLMLGVGGLLGYYIPLLAVNSRIRWRQEEIERELPDALDLLTISVEAGLGFDAAMSKVAQRWNNELGRVFGRTLNEVQMGKLRQEALRDMADRIQVEDISNFVAAVVQGEQLGVPMAKVLKVQSSQMRIHRHQRAQEKANQAPLKMLFPLAFLIFPAIVIVILGPTIIVLLNQGLAPR